MNCRFQGPIPRHSHCPVSLSYYIRVLPATFLKSADGNHLSLQERPDERTPCVTCTAEPLPSSLPSDYVVLCCSPPLLFSLSVCIRKFPLHLGRLPFLSLPLKYHTHTHTHTHTLNELHLLPPSSASSPPCRRRRMGLVSHHSVMGGGEQQQHGYLSSLGFVELFFRQVFSFSSPSSLPRKRRISIKSNLQFPTYTDRQTFALYLLFPRTPTEAADGGTEWASGK